MLRSARMRRLFHISATSQNTRTGLPSFSNTKWGEFAHQFGLPPSSSSNNFMKFKTRRYRLPPSLHVAMFEGGWRSQDVYREKARQTREEARVRLFDQYFVPILALFQGRVIDKPEQQMARTKYSSGGHVEHEIFVADRAIFLAEIKLLETDDNDLAQLLVEILSAAKDNELQNFPTLRIYGVLIGLQNLFFYSYDPVTNNFYFDEKIYVRSSRIEGLSDMVELCNKLFGVILTAYIEGLRTGITQSVTGRNRKSTKQWKTALLFAEKCCEKFDRPVKCLRDIERHGKQALALLAKSVRSIPRQSGFTGGTEDPSNPAELKKLATRVIIEAHERYW